MSDALTANVDAFLPTSLAISLPWLYFALYRRSFDSNVPANPHQTLHTAISLVLLLHTLYICYALFHPPPNLFKFFDMPTNTSNDAVELLVIHRLRRNGATEVPEQLQRLLGRLASFEMRTLYIRFGHTVITSCDYCHSFDDYALYALPKPLLAYVREAALIGLATIRNSRKEDARTLALGILISAAVAEAYLLLTTPITIPGVSNGVRKEVFMWHDTLYILRNTLFLVLPLLIQAPLNLSAIPRHPVALLVHLVRSITSLFSRSSTSPRTQASQPKPHPSQIAHTTTSLHQLLTKLHLLKYTRGATLRSPYLSPRALAWWAEEAREGAWVREDASVQAVARGVGVGFDEGVVGDADAGGREGVLRTSAKGAVGSLMTGFVPSQYWGQPAGAA